MHPSLGHRALQAAWCQQRVPLLCFAQVRGWLRILAVLVLGPTHCLLPAGGFLHHICGAMRSLCIIVYLQVEEAGVEAGTQGQDLDSLRALRCKMSVELLQELPEGEDSREVTCKKAGYSSYLFHIQHYAQCEISFDITPAQSWIELINSPRGSSTPLLIRGDRREALLTKYLRKSSLKYPLFTQDLQQNEA